MVFVRSARDGDSGDGNGVFDGDSLSLKDTVGLCFVMLNVALNTLLAIWIHLVIQSQRGTYSMTPCIQRVVLLGR